MHRPPDTTTASPVALLGDGETLRDILALGGPETARRLLAQIVTDLTATAAQLSAALAEDDLRQIRSASHVLISLVGTIGAMGLHADALALNEAAHRQDGAVIGRLGPALLADLDTLVAEVRAIGGAA